VSDQHPHPEDLPWNDVPADDDAVPGGMEPDPAEVVGDDDNPRDLSSRRPLDPMEHDTLDSRLAAEEPERFGGGSPAPEAAELMAGESGEDDVAPGEPDAEDPQEALELPAEEAAIHVVDDDRV
jgi:hypothetical protein